AVRGRPGRDGGGEGLGEDAVFVKGGNDADAKGTGGASRSNAQLSRQVLQVLEWRVNEVVEEVSRLRWLRASRRTLEKPRAERALELGDKHGDGRLHDVEPRGRGGNPAFFVDRDEIAQRPRADLEGVAVLLRSASI